MKKSFLRKSLSALLAAALALSLAACGNPSDTGTGSTGTANGSSVGSGDGAGTEAAGGTIDLKYALGEELNSLDPNYNYSATSMGMIMNTNEGLYKYGADGNIGLGLASDVQISEDGCTYTFTIRDDAYWSNGDPVTANDFYYSWRRLADPANGCTYAYMLITAGVKNAMEVIYGGGNLDDLGISAPDEKTFIVELDAPRSYFTELLAQGTYFMPVNQAFCEACGDQFMLDMEHSIYCGPFVMSEWEVGGTTYTMVKNENYYDADSVTTSSIHYTMLTDAQAKILAWESGELDQVLLTGDYISMYKEDPALVQRAYAGMFFISFNTENEYLSNKNLRLAVSTAIDKQPIVDSILCDGSNAADYIIPANFAKDSQGVFYRDNAGNPTYNSYDLTAAAEYWEAAKAELGTDAITLELLYNEDSSLASVAAYIQAQLQTNLPGLTVELRCTTYNQRLADMGNGDYDMGITRWYADYQDAATYLDMWIEGSNLNYGRWYNAQYNELYKQVVGELALDEEARIAAQAEMEKIFLEDGAVCPLYQVSYMYLENPNYTFVTTPSGITLSKYGQWANQ
ncbi:MAG: peptide ABC transporter substrate-binding protein [Lachnospiraceae bacterium]|nr:peptide ABC transporter substrate-binding protein [Lachnospiraceae bacterium]